MNSVPEGDWKIFRELHRVALERMCERALKEARTELERPGKSAVERFWDLNEAMRKQSKEVRYAFDDMRRSTAWLMIRLIYSMGLWREEVVGRFSEETRVLLKDIEPRGRESREE